MIRSANPRCCECARPLHIAEPFIGGVAQQLRCDGCGVHLRARRTAAGWETATLDEWKGQRTAPLPPVATPQLRARFFDACHAVARKLRGQGVEPGMADIEERA